MSCKIFRDFDTDEVVRVENPQGTESSLFREALGVMRNPEEALNTWAFAYTDSFKEQYGEWETEPKLSEVLSRLNLNTDEKLTLKNTLDVVKLMQSTGLDVNSLYSNLKKAFFNSKGQFVIDRNRLVNSQLYTSEEVNNLMDFPFYRGEVLNTIGRLRNSLSDEGTLFNDISAIIDEGNPLVISTGETNSVGKNEIIPIEEVETYLKTQIGSFSNEAEFQNAINSLPREDIREAILNNPEAIDYVRTLVENLKVLPEFIYKDGALLPKTVNDSFELIKNSLTIDDSKLDFTEALDFLRDTDNNDWYGADSEMVLGVLKEVENRAALHGLDLSGLSNKYNDYSKEEIIGFLDLVDDFYVKTENLEITEEDILELSNDINEFFDITPEPQVTTMQVNPLFKSKNLIRITDNVNEIDLYRVEGLINSFGDVYQRVQNINDYNSALELVYEQLMEDVTILPVEAFKDYGADGGYYNVDKITDPNFKANVLSSINNYITKKADSEVSSTEEDYDILREITLMKTLHNPIEIDQEVDYTVGERLLNFKGDYNYLTTDFISDFYKRVLEEKVVKNSELYNTALKYFTINSKGIDVTVTSPSILEQVKVLLQSEPILYENLLNYSLISKNSNLDFLRDLDSDTVVDSRQSRRDHVVNNPKSIGKFNKDFQRITELTVLGKNTTEEFIKLNDGIYELVSSQNGVSAYAKLSFVPNPDFYVFNTPDPIVDMIDLSTFIEPSPEVLKTDTHGISKKKLESLQEEKTC